MSGWFNCTVCGCGEKNDFAIVNYTGKPVCPGCARSIAKAFLECARYLPSKGQ